LLIRKRHFDQSRVRLTQNLHPTCGGGRVIASRHKKKAPSEHKRGSGSRREEKVSAANENSRMVGSWPGGHVEGVALMSPPQVWKHGESFALFLSRPLRASEQRGEDRTGSAGFTARARRPWRSRTCPPSFLTLAPFRRLQSSLLDRRETLPDGILAPRRVQKKAGERGCLLPAAPPSEAISTSWL